MMPAMFADHLLPNLLIFLVGQAAVIGLLRTGLVAHGVALVLGTWLFADAALVARLVFAIDGAGYVALLVAMQVLSLGGAAWLLHGRWRRTRPGVIADRERSFRDALRHYLRDELDASARILAGLCRRDPWDLPARLLRARVDAAAGRGERARAGLRRARGLDGAERYADLIHGELEALGRVAAGPVVAGAAATTAADHEPATELPRPDDDAGAPAMRRTRVVDPSLSKPSGAGAG